MIKKGHFYKELCKLLIKKDIKNQQQKGYFHKELYKLLIEKEIKIPQQKVITEKKIGTQKVQSPYEIYNRMTTLIKQILINSEDVWESGPQTKKSFFQNLWNLRSETIKTIVQFFQNQNNQAESEKAEKKYKKIRDNFGSVFLKAVDEIVSAFDYKEKNSFTDFWDKIDNYKKPSTKRRTTKNILGESDIKTKKCKTNESSIFSVDNCPNPTETKDFRNTYSGYRIFIYF